MNDILRILLGEARPRQAADESLFLSGRNYLGVRPPMPNIPPVAGLPPVPPQVGPVAGLVTINDNGQIIKLAPGEVYEGGIRIIPGPAPTFTGLLDDYPGAAAAYSLRRLSVNYTGPLVQVRRASDNDETTIPYKDDGTLDVGVLNAFAAGTDAFVSEWPDQSGNANDATQTTTANQPKIYDSVTGVVTENGKPALIEQSRNLILTATYSGAASSTVVSVAFLPSGFTKGLLLASGTNQFLTAQSGGTLSPFNGVGTPTIYVDGVSATFSTRDDAFTAFNLNQSLIFASVDLSSFSDLDFGQNTNTGSYAYQELIVYNSDQSTNRTGIESNINDYYSIY